MGTASAFDARGYAGHLLNLSNICVVVVGDPYVTVPHDHVMGDGARPLRRPSVLVRPCETISLQCAFMWVSVAELLTFLTFFRDIPMPLVSSGVEHGNLRELALARMKDLGTQCRDVRTREVGIQEIHHKVKPYEVRLHTGQNFAMTFLHTRTGPSQVGSTKSSTRYPPPTPQCPNQFRALCFSNHLHKKKTNKQKT